MSWSVPGLLIAMGLLIGGCGYDFEAPFSESNGSPVDGSAGLDAGNERDGNTDREAAGDASSECAVGTCAALGAECGQVVDGCGHVLECGDCPDAQTCGASVPNVCGVGTCIPSTCEELGATCGTFADGCGGTIECGGCDSPETCGGGGNPNQCGCTPSSCAELGVSCGTLDDGCGTALDCGVCPIGYRIRMYNFDCDSKHEYWAWSQTPVSDDIFFQSAVGSSYGGALSHRIIDLMGADGDASYFTYDVFFDDPMQINQLSCFTEFLAGNHTYACGEKLEYLYADGSTQQIPTLECTPSYGYHYSYTQTTITQDCTW